MTRFEFLSFLGFIRRLDDEAKECIGHDAAEQVPEPKRLELAGIVQGLRGACTQIGLLERSPVFSLTVNKLRNGCSFELLSTRLLDLRFAVIQELAHQQFAFIPTARSAYFEQDAIFGEPVARVLRDANADIKSAGNCFAAEEYTATVFHLMRAVEHGLRALARKLHVKLTHSRRPQPIEFADWDKVIRGCKDKIDAARGLSSGAKRQERLELYSDTADHCVYMKDIWRNNVSHTRRPYIESEAQAVMERVRGFMALLAERVL